MQGGEVVPHSPEGEPAPDPARRLLPVGGVGHHQVLRSPGPGRGQPKAAIGGSRIQDGVPADRQGSDRDPIAVDRGLTRIGAAAAGTQRGGKEAQKWAGKMARGGRME